MKKDVNELNKLMQKSGIHPVGNAKAIPFCKKIIRAGLRVWEPWALVLALSRLGMEYLLIHDYDSAEQTARRLIKIQKGVKQESIKTYYILTGILLEKRKYRAVWHWFQKAYKLKTQDPQLVEELKNKLAIEFASKYPPQHPYRKGLEGG